MKNLALLAIAMLTATPTHGDQRAEQRATYRDPTAPLEQRVADLLARMTQDEKIAQLTAIWTQKNQLFDRDGRFDPAAARRLYPNGIGQFSRPADLVGPGNPFKTPYRDVRQTIELVNAIQRHARSTRLGIPVLFHEEGLHGYAARGATHFPQAIALASSWDPALLERVFTVAGREIRARGVQLVLAPVVDVGRDPRWGRIEETYGEDPYLVGELGVAAVRGFQGPALPLAKDHVFATLKHMTGHGQPESGSNVGPANLSERILREVFFPPFRAAVERGNAQAVMPSYNEIDGVPSHVNRWLLRDVLRKEWGFKGAIVSDYFAVNELVTRHKMYSDVKNAAERAIESGVDSETPDPQGFVHLPELVRSGRVSQAAVDEAVRRVLRMKFESGLFENPYADAATAEAKTATPDAIALAREAAQKAVVLLKNDKGVLPLNPASIRRMAVVGTHARNTPIGGYSDEPRHVVSVLEGLQTAAKGRFEVDYAEGVRLTETRCWSCDEVKLIPTEVNRKLIAEAVDTARKSDVIVMVLGENEQLSREAWADAHLGDRASLDMVGQQEKLARAIFALGKPTVVILLNGRPLSVNYLAANAPALIEGWYLGQETGNAVADVLFGTVNPGGKLPVSFARSAGQLPVYYNRKPTSRRGYLFDSTAPLYPFGFGLSYTTFDVSAPRFARSAVSVGDNVQISVNVANTGRLAGDEVVQLYVRDDEASITRPLLELKRFQRVTLQPGERRTVTFELKPDDLALWNMDMKRVVEPGTFTISAGPNSVDLKSAKLTVAAR